MPVKKNTVGVSYAKTLIRKGQYNVSTSWSISSAEKRRLLGDPPDYKAYKRWFFGIDSTIDKNTMGAYKYPFGKRGKVYRSALIAIRQRSAQQGVTSIFAAAGTLIKMIDGKEESKNSLSFAEYVIHESNR